MSASRNRYANAYGPLYNFQARSDNCFAQSDATPDVSLGTLFYSINTTATIITDFDGGEEGQVITVIMLDNYTGLANSGELVLAGSGSFEGANNSITLIQHNTSWYEVSRSQNSTGVYNYVSTGSASNAAMIDVKGVNIVTMLGSGAAPIKLIGLSNGTIGQEVTLVNVGSAVLIANSIGGATNILITSTLGAATVIVATSTAFKSVQMSNAWFELTDVSPTGVV